MNVLLLQAFAYAEMFTESLPSNGYTCHNILCKKKINYGITNDVVRLNVEINGKQTARRRKKGANIIKSKTS
jgi:hypothetical protein